MTFGGRQAGGQGRLAPPHPSRPGRARERPVGAEHLPCLGRGHLDPTRCRTLWLRAVPCAPGGRVRSLRRDPRRNSRRQVEPSYGRGVIGPGARSGVGQGHGVVSRRWWSSVVRAWISRVIWVFGAAAAEASTAPPPRPRPPPADQPNHRPVTRGSQPIRARGPADPTARSRLSLFDTRHLGLIGVGVGVRVVCRPRIARHPAGQGCRGHDRHAPRRPVRRATHRAHHRAPRPGCATRPVRQGSSRTGSSRRRTPIHPFHPVHRC